MTVYQNQNQGASQQDDIYDLEAEKKRIAEGTEEIKKELWEKWQKRYANAQIFPDKLKTLNANVIDSLLSFENTFFYNHLADKFNLSQEQRDGLPQIVWEISIEKKWQDLESLIKNKLNISQAREITEEIERSILSKIKDLPDKKVSIDKFKIEKQSQPQTEKLSFSDALKKYAEIGEQLITGEKISLKNFPEAVRPSIKNWLSDYAFNSGYDQHNSMERGAYLFQNKNAKILSSADRQKLAYILKAYDENETVEINANLKQIIFPKSEFAPREETKKEMSSIRENEMPQDIFEKYSPVQQVKQAIPERKAYSIADLKPAAPREDINQNSQIQNKQADFSGSESSNFFVSQKNERLRPEANLPKPEKKIDYNHRPPMASASAEGINHISNFRPQADLAENARATQAQSMPSARNMEFSSPQKLPVENQKKPAETFSEPKPQLQFNPPAQGQTPFQPQPLRITPQGFGKYIEESANKNSNPSKNVVDLRE